jgi:hypothetical protein
MVSADVQEGMTPPLEEFSEKSGVDLDEPLTAAREPGEMGSCRIPQLDDVA